MLTGGLIILASFAYVGLLFGIAYYGDKRADAGRSIIANPYIYALSLAVYCTSWTFYGSVGRAATTGIGFLPIYLGPTLMAALWWYVMLKIIRISKANRITSIADFIACLLEGRPCELESANALKASEVIFALYESSRRRGRVDLPLDIDDHPLAAMVESGALKPRPKADA